jgi:hypothetical protein
MAQLSARLRRSGGPALPVGSVVRGGGRVVPVAMRLDGAESVFPTFVRLLLLVLVGAVLRGHDPWLTVATGRQVGYGDGGQTRPS